MYYIEFNNNNISINTNGESDGIFYHHGNLSAVEKAVWVAFDNILFNLSEYVIKAFNATSDKEFVESIRNFNNTCCKRSHNSVQKAAEMSNMLYNTLYTNEAVMFIEDLITALKTIGTTNVIVGKYGQYEYLFTFHDCHTIITDGVFMDYHEPFEIPYINTYVVSQEDFTKKLKSSTI